MGMGHRGARDGVWGGDGRGESRVRVLGTPKSPQSLANKELIILLVLFLFFLLERGISEL